MGYRGRELLQSCTTALFHPSSRLISSQLTRWIAIESVSMFIELMLFTLSLYFAWDIQMSWNSKAVVVGAFACRLLYVLSALQKNVGANCHIV